MWRSPSSIVEGALAVAGADELRRAPHESLEPRDEFAHREGLGHVVVGSHTEPHEHVGLLIAGREHEYPELAETTDSPTHFEPIEAGEHDVKDDGIGLEVFDRRDA